jgi:leucyl-tRNA synthetase
MQTEESATQVLLNIQQEAQEYWEKENIYERNASTSSNSNSETTQNKFFVTFPYPYMNGNLHLGHAYSVTKAEFTTRYQTLIGKNSLFPFSFHCTGTAIMASAYKLRNEVEQYGNPPVFPLKPPQNPDEVELYQWEIMQKMGLKDDEIIKFVDPRYWLEYFPVTAQRDMKKFGAAIDYRRSFVTTNKNPYYDSFVSWQFNTLNKLGKIAFGNRCRVQ